MLGEKDISLQGRIVNYRRGLNTQKSKECLLRFQRVDSTKKAGRLIGRKVAWSVGKTVCHGKIVALHGKQGLVRVRFRKGVPGEALGKPIRIIG